MSIAKCFTNIKNRKLNKLYKDNIKEGLEEEAAAIDAIQKYANRLGKEISKVSNEASITLEGDFKRSKQEVEVKKQVMLQETVKTKVTSEEPTIKGTRNKVFRYFEEALESPELYNALMTSIDNDTTESMIVSMLPSKKKTSLNIFRPSITTEIRFNLKAGASGIGDMVNANNDHIRSQGKNILFRLNTGEWGNEKFDESQSEPLDKTESKNDPGIREILADINSKREQDGKEPFTIDDINIRKISDVLSELTNAFVDIANNAAFITRANWGNVTNRYGTMLLRKGVHPLKVFSMFNNPAMSELLNRMGSNEGIITNKSSFEIREKLGEDLRVIFNEFYEAASEEEINSYKEIKTIGDINVRSLYFSAKEQGDNPLASINTLEKADIALTIFDHYNDSIEVTRKYGRAVTTAKVGESGTGTSLGTAVVAVNKLTDALEPTVRGEGFANLEAKYFDDKGNPTLLYKYHDNTLKLLSNIIKNNPNIFSGITETVFDNINGMIADSNRNKLALDPYVVNQILGVLDTLYMSNFANINNEYTVKEEEELLEKFYSLRKVKKIGVGSKQWPILNKIRVNTIEENTIFYANKVNSLSNNIKNELTANWKELLEKHPDLGEFLIRKAFRQSGLQSGLGTFHQLIPKDWYESNGIREHIKKNKINFPDFLPLQLAVNRIGPKIFGTQIKANSVKEGEFIESDRAIGEIDKLKKFPLFAKDRFDSMFMLVGIRIDSLQKPKEQKPKITRKGIYVKLPKVKEGEVYYSSNSRTFNDKYGIKSIDEYFDEINVEDTRKITKGWKAGRLFLEVDMQDYRNQHIPRIDITALRSLLITEKETDNQEVSDNIKCV